MLFERFETFPFGPKRLIFVTLRPAVPALLTIRRKEDFADRIAQGSVCDVREKYAPAAFLNGTLVCPARDEPTPVARRKLGIDPNLAQLGRHKLCGIIKRCDVGWLENNDLLAGISSLPMYL
ncbi:hypothetical protein [Rhizobium sp. 007]|uniref:hypothetical protein n=1 Tax=Rhizobium sp. 007 TaxID=2785056 RepID=UPI00188ED70F|nr:hypothetical protein ISN39_35100 [Rhizobium sp. 007]